MPVPLPGFFGSFSVKSPPNPVSERQQEVLQEQEQAVDKGKAPRKGSMVTITMAANTPTAPAIGPVVLMRGILQKRTTGAVSARWVTRTVVIEGAPSHMLCYYDASEKGKPKNVLRLSELTSRRKDTSECVFLVVTVSRSYEFRASSAAESAEWVACISAAAERATSEWQEQQEQGAGSSRPSPSSMGSNVLSPPLMGDSRPSPPSAPPAQTRSVFARTTSAVRQFSPRKFSGKQVERIPAPDNNGSTEWEDVLPSTPKPGLAWDGGGAFDEATEL